MSWLAWHLLTPAIRKLLTRHNPHNELCLSSNKVNKFCFSEISHENKTKHQKTSIIRNRQGADPADLHKQQQSPNTPCKGDCFSSLVLWQILAAAFPTTSFWAHFSSDAAAVRKNEEPETHKDCWPQDDDTARKKKQSPCPLKENQTPAFQDKEKKAEKKYGEN